MRSETRGPLERHLPRTPTSEDEFHLMRRKVWRQQRILVVQVDSVTDEWLRWILTDLGNKLYGAETK